MNWRDSFVDNFCVGILFLNTLTCRLR